jgi:hypothetical protein
MMELQRSCVASIATDHTSPTGLLDKDLLDFAPATRHRFRAALCATQPTLRRNAHVPHHPVLLARNLSLPLPGLVHSIQRCATVGSRCLETMSLQPITGRRVADPKTLCDLFNCQALRN